MDTPHRAPTDVETSRTTENALIRNIRQRILSGLVFALPIVITFWIIYWVYSTLQRWILDPAALLAQRLIGQERLSEMPIWWQRYVSPFIAIGLALILLYVLGYFVRSKIDRAFDWLISRLPLVTIVYKAVRNLFESLLTSQQAPRFKRVVLVEFPHPGLRALAFVTASLRDGQTGKTILCIWVLTGVMPPAGFTLFVPEEDVTDLDWSVNLTLSTIVSGGITAPPNLPFFPSSGKPVVSRTGNPPT